MSKKVLQNIVQPVTGVILAGGKSRRMGTNKALLEINGEKVVNRIEKHLNNITNDIVLITNNLEAFSFIQHKIAKDIHIGKGPLSGIHSGITHSTNEWCFVVACDLPFFNEPIGQYMISLIGQEPIGGIVPKINGKLHPLYALYHRSILQEVENSLNSNTLKITELLEKLDVCIISERDFYKKGFTEEEVEMAFFNMNRPEDYIKAQHFNLKLFIEKHKFQNRY
ncbi:molybdenum cofactor guanylyltransferase [Evansella sp. AB-P1]|uniref:molybdenum cofactor guanylyltransferase n=1 Tax=Evansella sp. AB-P1 TaxID=3037653 RepID=UPI00241FB850|nr:molybdenum cofactor guanylyltransferase [Evansella sp. AB-P1]MDG5787816.1 molybdenum cofactor guanylyltransferase [Evansella sp. AB-P1]